MVSRYGWRLFFVGVLVGVIWICFWEKTSQNMNLKRFKAFLIERHKLDETEIGTTPSIELCLGN
jgi:hypothetical protein